MSMRQFAPVTLFLLAWIATGCGPSETTGEAAPGVEQTQLPAEETTTDAIAEEPGSPSTAEEPVEAVPPPAAGTAPGTVIEALSSKPYTLDQFPAEHKTTYTNTLDKPVTVKAQWSFAGSVWQVEPAEAEFAVQPGETGHATAMLKLTDNGRRFPYPVPTLAYEISSDGRKVDSSEHSLKLEFIREARVPTAAAAPVIDGKREGTWDEASVRIGGFLLSDGTYLANPPTEVWVTRTLDKLYVFFTCYERKTERLLTASAERDDAIEMDDSVEIFITAPRGGKYYHFLVSANGVVRDAMNEDAAWDGAWESRTHVGEGRWTVEIAIPARTIGLRSLKRLKELRVNFCRNRYAGKRQLSSWNCTHGSFHQPELFGRLVF